MSNESNDNRPWYSGISRYQWMVLVIASLGWVFDVFEGQIFVASSDDAMPSFIARDVADGTLQLSAEEQTGLKQFYNNIAFAAFLIGGAVGGIVFGMLSDRIGRKKTMTLTIVFYSLFTCVSAFSAEWWHLAALRFFVAMGVGGEWAVASALVFEEFPKRSRAQVGSIFHASSVLGTYLAVAATALFIGNVAVKNWMTELALSWGITDPVLAESVSWRVGFALGALPALLIIWIRSSLKEPEEWAQARADASTNEANDVGRLGDLFNGGMLRNTLVGFGLAAVGMATFWGVHIHGKASMKAAGQRIIAAETAPISEAERTAAEKRWEMLGMFLVTTGGGIGLICFGSISQRIGRRGAFLLYHIGGLVSALVLFGWMLNSPETLSTGILYLLLPVFGFLTLGMHAGYAIYFPELFPTRLRGTGSGFSFNGGRIAAAPILFLSGWLQKGTTIGGFTIEPIGLVKSCLLLSSLYLLGVLILAAAPETRQLEGDTGGVGH
ncbi:MAG: MFS transporter [Planctomycetaceae bacterium]